jgi:hypothetical protein
MRDVTMGVDLRRGDDLVGGHATHHLSCGGGCPHADSRNKIPENSIEYLRPDLRCLEKVYAARKDLTEDRLLSG